MIGSKWKFISIATLILSATVAHADLTTSKSGRAPGPGLSLKGSKVPKFDLVQTKIVKGKKEVLRVKEIPRLDIGEEPVYKTIDPTPLQLPGAKSLKMLQVKKLADPPAVLFDPILLPKMKAVETAKVVIRVDPMWKAPEPPKYRDVGEPVTVEPRLDQKNMDELSPAQLKLLQALIFLEEAKNYKLALGLFAELTDDKEVKMDAKYQLAMTSKALGMYSEYKHQMLKVINEGNKDWQKRAVQSLALNAEPGDKNLVDYLDPKIESLKVDLTKADQYLLNRAKYFIEKGDLTKALGSADEIPMDSPIYSQTLFLKSLILYRVGQLSEAIGLQQQLLDSLVKQGKDVEIRSITALTLARLLFQQGDYKEAFQAYLKVDKKHPEWLQAMVEQAWSQILAGDYEGAAGNMFSLHTDFFKKAFTPESFVVRTVAYLNLCQFGDGSKVIFDLKKRYAPTKAKIEKYLETHKDDIEYYDTVKNWAKNFDLKEVDGVPRELIFSLTRHPSFIDEQQMINSIEDQVNRVNKVALDILNIEKELIKKESNVRDEQARLRKVLEEAKTDKEKQDAKDGLAYQEKRLLSYKIQHYIAKKARLAIKDLRKDGITRLDKEEEGYRKRAAKALRARMNFMLTTLNQTLDQADVLQYELYSGAGEHLRYQMAGGKIDEKERPELKVADNKALKWDFRGEVWEDEIGHFRSSLKNVCAPDENVPEDNSIKKTDSRKAEKDK